MYPLWTSGLHTGVPWTTLPSHFSLRKNTLDTGDSRRLGVGSEKFINVQMDPNLSTNRSLRQPVGGIRKIELYHVYSTRNNLLNPRMINSGFGQTEFYRPGSEGL